MRSLTMRLLFCQLGVLAVADTMKAGALKTKHLDMQVHLEDIALVDVPVPVPSSGQVLVKVAASSVNPVDWKLMESPYALKWSYPHVFGRDLAGTVVSVGSGVQRLKVGDSVWADNSAPEGAYAEYVLVEEEELGVAPTTLTLVEAATIPLVSLTNLAAFTFAGIGPKAAVPTIVVLGGSGGCGHTAIQMAKAFGASKVVTTCGTEHVDFCKQLGADVVVDYHKQKWQDVLGPKSVDFVYDTVGLSGTGDIAFATLKDGGYFTTLLGSGLASAATQKARPSVKQHAVGNWPKDYTKLDVLRSLAEAGHLKPHIAKTFAISEVAAAFNASMGGHTGGKISIAALPARAPTPAASINV